MSSTSPLPLIVDGCDQDRGWLICGEHQGQIPGLQAAARVGRLQLRSNVREPGDLSELGGKRVLEAPEMASHARRQLRESRGWREPIRRPEFLRTNTPVGRLAKACSGDRPARPASFRTEIENDRIGQEDPLEADLTAKKADDARSSLNQLLGMLDLETGGGRRSEAVGAPLSRRRRAPGRPLSRRRRNLLSGPMPVIRTGGSYQPDSEGERPPRRFHEGFDSSWFGATPPAPAENVTDARPPEAGAPLTVNARFRSRHQRRAGVPLRTTSPADAAGAGTGPPCWWSPSPPPCGRGFGC
jgi:hypothetical protein